MEFQKRMKQRLYSAYFYFLFGFAMIAVAVWKSLENEFFFSYGVTMIVIGIVRTRQYRKINASPEALRAQEIAETDERNLMLASKAKSCAFFWYVMLCGVAVIILEFLNQPQLATLIALSICFLCLIYYVSYHVLKRKY